MINLLNQYFQNTSLIINHTLICSIHVQQFETKIKSLHASSLTALKGFLCPISFSIQSNYKSTFPIIPSHPMFKETKNTMSIGHIQDSAKPRNGQKFDPINIS